MNSSNCVVCGKPFGIFSRISGDARDGICHGCEKEGAARLADLVLAIDSSPADSRPPDYWIGRFNELAAQFQISEERSSTFIPRLVESILLWLEKKDAIPDHDAAYAAAMAQKFSSSLTDAAKEAGQRLTRRLTIQNWEAGRPPSQHCSGLLLEPGEICRWEEGARLYEQRTHREYAGASQGISLRIARGMYYRIGAFRGAPMDTSYLADLGGGLLHITDRRLGFTGEQRAVAIPFKKMISVSAFAEGFHIFQSSAKKPTIMQVAYPELTLHLLALATPAEND